MGSRRRTVQATSAPLGPDLDALVAFPLHSPVRCCLAAMGRRGQLARGVRGRRKFVAL